MRKDGFRSPVRFTPGASQSQWLEELSKAKAGGLDTISVYVFWIYHEGVAGNFVFAGH